MKKKIVAILLAIVLLLPMVVNADAWVPNIYYNHTTVVGGSVEESIIFTGYDITKFDNITVEYDKEYLSITPKYVQIIVSGQNILEDSSKGSVNVEDGKIIIIVTDLSTKPNSHPVADEELGWDSAQSYISLKFTALKAGNTTIKAPNKGYYKLAKITIEEKNCPVPAEAEDPSEPIGSSDTTEPVEPEGPTPEEDDSKEKAKPVTEETNNIKEILFYCSLGLNALLLILVIVLVLTKKKKKEEKPVEVAPVETVPTEAAPTQEQAEPTSDNNGENN